MNKGDISSVQLIGGSPNPIGAAAARPESGFAMEQFDQLLTCCICLDRYRNPKLLPCQHSYCMEPCMEGLVDYVKRRVRERGSKPSLSTHRFVPILFTILG